MFNSYLCHHNQQLRKSVRIYRATEDLKIITNLHFLSKQ